MASIITSCPECKKQIKVPAEIAGKKIRCKGCGNTFVVTSTAVRPEPGRPEGESAPIVGQTFKLADDEDDGKPYGVTDLDLTARCPHCAAEMEDDEAIICLKCGYNTQTREMGRRMVIREATGEDWFWWLLPGILCVFVFFCCFAELINVVAGWVIKDISEYDRIERSGYNCCVLWMSIFCIWIMYHSGKYAIKRLAINYRPPEEEIKK